MTIELSSITFTPGADIVPESGEEDIINSGIANTLAGDDTIAGIAEIRGPYESGILALTTPARSIRTRVTTKSLAVGTFTAFATPARSIRARVTT